MAPDPSAPTPRSYDAYAHASVWRMPGVVPLVLYTVAGFGGFSVLLSVVPLWVVEGGANEFGAGLVTAVLLLSTVATQALVPWLWGRFGHRLVLSAGLVALGVPSVGYGLSDQLAPVLVLSAVRGVGFGILTVSGSAVVADLVPIGRRGEAIGIYGLGIAIPNLAFLPASVAVADRLGFWTVFVAGAMPVLGIPAVVRLTRVLGQVTTSQASRRDDPTPQAGDRRRAASAVAVPALVLLAITLAGGALMTFLPQLVDSSTLSAVALLVMGGAAAFTRWWIGRVADRSGAGRMLAPLLLVAALGLVATAAAVRPDGVLWLLLPAVAVVGGGYGALQNLTLMASFSRVRPPHYGVASAVWNIGFDAGTALGAVLLGAVAASAGFAPGLLVMAALVAAAAPLGWHLRRS